MNMATRVGKAVLYTLGLTALFLAVSITSAYALTFDGIAQAQVDVDTEADVDASVDDVLDTDVDVEADLGATTSLEADDEATSTTGSDVEGVLETSILVDRGDIQGEAGVVIDVNTPEEVEDEDTFRSYALSLLEEDEFLKRVESADSDVSVTYAQRGELFGFIPVYVNTEVVVSAEGEVDIDYPWYRFLTDVEEDNLEEDIQARVSLITDADIDTTATTTATTTDADMEVSLSMREKAEIVEAVHEVLQASLSADIEAEGEADTAIAE